MLSKLLMIDLDGLNWDGLEREAGILLEELFPICRSITGEGVRRTLRRLSEVAGFELFEVPSGTRCFDWTVPDEWNPREAWIQQVDGPVVCDFAWNNLHLVGYSESVDAELGFDELTPRLHSLPAMPGAIPYRTSYYRRGWGFCLEHERLMAMDRNARYRVRIDADLKPGALTGADLVLPGSSGREFLVSTYCCHPSLANDNLSGLVLTALLARETARMEHRHGYRFVIVPETIGAIAYLWRNQAALERVEAGLIPTTVAGPGPLGYKLSFLDNSVIDRAALLALEELGSGHVTHPFDVNGSDETQYSAPHFRIPMGTICKDKYYDYPQYHTSLDNLDFVSASALVVSLRAHLCALRNLEADLAFESAMPYCEPMLGPRGLYPGMGGAIRQPASAETNVKSHRDRRYRAYDQRDMTGRELDALKWLMFLADGCTTLLDVAQRTGLDVGLLAKSFATLEGTGLLRARSDGGAS